MNLDDPELTAFALDELREPERSKIARVVRSSPEAQHEVEEIRSMAGALRKEFGGNDANAGVRAPEHRSLADIRGDRWFWTVARPLSVAATIAVLGVLGLIVFGGRRLHILPSRPATTEIELVDNAPRERNAPEVANPLQIDLIESVDHAVVGELTGEVTSGGEMVRLVDEIRDPKSVAKLKERLTTPKLRTAVSEGRAVRSYRIIFLDRMERTVALADFSCGGASGALLRLVRAKGTSPLPGNWQAQIDYTSYAIPFPDWKEAVGFCPGEG